MISEDNKLVEWTKAEEKRNTFAVVIAVVTAVALLVMMGVGVYSLLVLARS